MASKRDDFSEKTKHVIASRVAYRCSKPDCQAPTCGPTLDDSRSYNLGVACHITAASEGFARYDKSLTPEQRKHASNGIWMCQSHGKEIDNDEQQYPVDLLVQWKKDAEERALQELGKVPESAGGSTPIVSLSKATRYGLNTMARLTDNSEIPLAWVFRMDEGGLVWTASGTFILRFLIAKKPNSPSVTLFSLNAIVYQYGPIPKHGVLAYALPQQVYPHFVTLEPPINDKPRPCAAKFYCLPSTDTPIPSAPLTISDDCPEVIDVRFSATVGGVYEFALDATVMVGAARHTYRVFDRSSVLFLPQYTPDEEDVPDSGGEATSA